MAIDTVMHRAFYVCPLPREDPKRCKFFVWEDEIHKNAKSDQAPETPCVGRSRFGGSTGQALGQTPVGHSSSSVGLHTPHSLSKGKQAASVLSDNEDDLVPVEDDIDWGAVDVDGLEREAIAGSQNSVKKHGTRDSISSTPTLGFNERLSSVMTGMKRDREEEDEDLRTPKKANIDVRQVFTLTRQTPADNQLIYSLILLSRPPPAHYPLILSFFPAYLLWSNSTTNCIAWTVFCKGQKSSSKACVIESKTWRVRTKHCRIESKS